MNRRHVISLAALALAGAMLFPTMAAPLSEDSDRVNEDIDLEPYGGPNGAYAVMEDQDGDGEDELGLDFSDENPAVEGDGVNAGSLTPVHRVFTVTYTGDRAAKVYLTDDSHDITFYRGTDTTTSLEGESNAVVLGPDQSLVVGVLIDARDGDRVESVQAFTVHANVTEPETTTDTVDEGGDDGGSGSGGGGDGGGDGENGDGSDDTDVGIQSTPESTPTDGTDDAGGNEDADTPTDGGTGTAEDTGADGTTTVDPGSPGTTTTVTTQPAGTTVTTAETAADPAGDAGPGGESGFRFAGLPWWLALLALVLALVVAGVGYYELGA